MNTQLKHILLVTSEFPPLPGGIGNHAFNLAKGLNKNEFLVEVITDQRSKNNIEEIHFDKNFEFKTHRVLMKSIRLLMYFERIQLLFKQIKKAEIVIASGKYSLWIVAFSSLFYKRKFIAIIHGSEVNYRSSIIRNSVNLSLHRFWKIIAVSNYTKSLISNLKYDNIIVIPNGFDESKWSSSNPKEIILKGKPKLITVGNVTERKGQLNVIKQLPDLIKTYPSLHYHCVGIPTMKDEFLKIAMSLNVDEYITFHGSVSDERLKSLLQSCDVFIMLSNTTNTGDVEGFGIAILEANYLGLPSIGAINCGIEDAINNYFSGILIQPDGLNSILDALSKILYKYDDYSKNAREWALEHSWRNVIEQYTNVLQE